MPEEQQDYGFQQTSNLQETNNFLEKMIDVEETIHKFEMEVLRRKRLSIDLKTKSKKWVPIAEGVKPICNELVISEILGLMRGRVTIIGRLTKKTDEEIYKDMFQFDRTLSEMIALRADEWELDEEMAKPLKEDCLSIVQDVIFSALNGFSAINVKSTYGRQENVSTSGNEDTEVNKILGIRIKK
jgi:hypothetical protein